MEIMIYTIVGFAALVFAAVRILAQCCFDDDDPELIWYDSYATPKCQHINKADVVVDYTVTLEKVETYCLDCGEKLAERLDW